MCPGDCGGQTRLTTSGYQPSAGPLYGATARVRFSMTDNQTVRGLMSVHGERRQTSVRSRQSRMKLRSLVPILDVHDVDASIDFYCGVLGFAVRDKVAWDGRTEWALVRCDQVQLMLCASNEPEVEEGGRGAEGMFFMYHEDPKALQDYVAARGYRQTDDALQLQNGRRDFYLRDPDGYVLWFSCRHYFGDQATDAITSRVAAPDGMQQLV